MALMVEIWPRVLQQVTSDHDLQSWICLDCISTRSANWSENADSSWYLISHESKLQFCTTDDKWYHLRCWFVCSIDVKHGYVRLQTNVASGWIMRLTPEIQSYVFGVVLDLMCGVSEVWVLPFLQSVYNCNHLTFACVVVTLSLVQISSGWTSHAKFACVISWDMVIPRRRHWVWYE